MRPASFAGTPPRHSSSCALSTSMALPDSRSEEVSPMQSMAFSPCLSAALTFPLMDAFVSPKCCLRSEWPSSTQEAPQLLTIAAEISPVNAPFSSACMFCANSSASWSVLCIFQLAATRGFSITPFHPAYFKYLCVEGCVHEGGHSLRALAAEQKPSTHPCFRPPVARLHAPPPEEPEQPEDGGEQRDLLRERREQSLRIDVDDVLRRRVEEVGAAREQGNMERGE